jgi:hypothetical protein
LIQVSNERPDDAYVSVRVDGKWYSIGNDAISKKNFALIAQFLIMQAVPSQTPPLTPSISVGGLAP